MSRQPDARPPNRLARETSPYLLQHAHNPVDWYAWGPEAFAAARKRDVPIFLSVGYSTCYWCHVMERESFENEQIAAIMNSHFVCIKVDREERPDVDDLYMTATQAMTSSGGWPMSVFLEPKTLKPFWCGTYFPPESRWGRPGFPELLNGINEAWKKQREDVGKQADELAEAVKERLAGRSAPLKIGERQVAVGVGQLLKIHDHVNGGFGEAPKFPQPVYLELLLRFRAHAGDDETAQGVDASIRETLDGMALGGIFDQVGGGFHRYSVDEKWLVPHFEKMLYDNAQLAEVYAKAARAFDDPFYRRITARTLDYVLREMTDPRGGFYSAQDAEVNHREGQNYLWTPDQMRAVLDAEDAKFAIGIYALDSGTNFKDPHHPSEPGSNVLFMRDRPEHIARSRNMPEAELLSHVDRVNETLYAARARRDQPRRDDKVLAGWNGLMIAAFALGGNVLERKDYLDAAKRAADFVLASMRDADGGLLRSYRRPDDAPGAPAARIPAFLEDYAMLVHGLIEIHRAGIDADGAYLDQARRLVDDAEVRFADLRTGAYFDTRADQDDLFVRARTQYDGAIPCGSSVMLNNLLDLFAISGDAKYLDRASRLLVSMSSFVAAAPVGAVNSTRALLRMLTEHPAALAAAFKDAPDPGDKSQEEKTQPVAIYAAVDRVPVSKAKAGALIIQLRIADGYHVNAADPGPGGKELIGLRVKMINGTGVAAYADYPKGESYKPEWSDQAGEILVYKGTVSIPVVLERDGEHKGAPLLAVTYQACTDQACLAPATLELSVAIDVED